MPLNLSWAVLSPYYTQVSYIWLKFADDLWLDIELLSIEVYVAIFAANDNFAPRAFMQCFLILKRPV